MDLSKYNLTEDELGQVEGKFNPGIQILLSCILKELQILNAQPKQIKEPKVVKPVVKNRGKK